MPDHYRPDRVAIEYYSSRSQEARLQIGYRSGKQFNPTKLDHYTNASRPTRSSTRQIHDRSSNASRWAWLLDQLDLLLDKYTTAPRTFSMGLASRSYSIVLTFNDLHDHSRPLPITHTDRVRPVPDYLFGLDRVDRIGGGNVRLRGGTGHCLIYFKKETLSHDNIESPYRLKHLYSINLH